MRTKRDLIFSTYDAVIVRLLSLVIKGRPRDARRETSNVLSDRKAFVERANGTLLVWSTTYYARSTRHRTIRPSSSLRVFFSIVFFAFAIKDEEKRVRAKILRIQFCEIFSRRGTFPNRFAGACKDDTYAFSSRSWSTPRYLLLQARRDPSWTFVAINCAK